MLTSIFHAGAFDAGNVLTALAFSLLLGVLVAAVCRLGTSTSAGFTVVLSVMPFLVASVIMIVNGNLGTSVAVLGAFGLVRFRSSPGTAREILFLFWAMAVGLAVGMGFLSLAVLLTIVGAVWILLMEKVFFGRWYPAEKQLRITIPEDLEYDGVFDGLLERYARNVHLESIRTTNMGTMYELTYRLEMKRSAAGKEKEMLDALRCRNGNLTIVYGLARRERNEF